MLLQLMEDYRSANAECKIGYITHCDSFTKKQFETLNKDTYVSLLDDNTGESLADIYLAHFRCIGETEAEAEAFLMAEKIAIADAIDQSEAVIVFHVRDDMEPNDYFIISSDSEENPGKYLYINIGDSPRDKKKTLYTNLVIQASAESGKPQMHVMYCGDREFYTWFSMPNNPFAYGGKFHLSDSDEALAKFLAMTLMEDFKNV